MSKTKPLESLDLSGLPEVLRKKVQEQLNRMTPEMQQEFLKKSRPMLNRAMDAAKTFAHDNDPDHKLTNRPTPRGHYNGTIQPGDRGSNAVIKLIAFVIFVMLVYSMFD
jgi:hypothetical protein